MTDDITSLTSFPTYAGVVEAILVFKAILCWCFDHRSHSGLPRNDKNMFSRIFCWKHTAVVIQILTDLTWESSSTVNRWSTGHSGTPAVLNVSGISC